MEGIPLDPRSTSSEVRVDRDIVFTTRATGDLVLDLYRCATQDTATPVVIWLHGGGWFTGDKTLAPDLSNFVRATGMAIASTEYRLSRQALYPAQLHDVGSAIRFLKGSARRFRLDPLTTKIWMPRPAAIWRHWPG